VNDPTRPDTGTLQIRLACTALHSGGIVVHATEGVWGLACDPFDEAAVRALLALKERPVAQGLIVIGASADVFAPELEALDPGARAEVCRGWPGRHTWIVPNRRFPQWVTGAHSTCAIRVPGHAQARALCDCFGGPLVSSSANPTGRPPARSELAARRYFQGRAGYILHGQTDGTGRPSVMHDATSGRRLRG
jgi:L-threonylcarbamoyladenylate synthase